MAAAGVFARLALAAGEFPVAGVDGPRRALPDQETIAAADDADADRDRLLRCALIVA